MTKGEKRKARKAAIQAGRKLTGELSLNSQHGGPAMEFSATPAGYTARERWARHYDSLNGAPEDLWDC